MESRTNAQRLVSKLALVTLLPCHVCSLRGLATRPRRCGWRYNSLCWNCTLA